MENVAQYHQKHIAKQDAEMSEELRAVLSGFCAKVEATVQTAQKNAKQQRAERLAVIFAGISESRETLQDALRKRTQNSGCAWENIILVEWQLRHIQTTLEEFMQAED